MKLLGPDPLWVSEDEVDAQDVVIATTRDELQLLAGSLNEALETVEAWEFHTRLGSSPEEARALRSKISALLDELRQPE